MSEDIKLRLGPRPKGSGPLPYICALAVVIVATLLRRPVTSILGDASPFLFYWPAALITAVLFGLKPGLAATALAAMLADYFWMPPHGRLGLNKVEFLQELTFCFGSGTICLLSEWTQRERHQREHFQRTLASAGEAIITTDALGKVQYLNSAAQLLLGIRSDDAIGQLTTNVVVLLARSNRRHMDQILLAMLLDGNASQLQDHCLLVSNGTESLVKVTVSRILNYHQQSSGSVIVLSAYCTAPKNGSHTPEMLPA